MHLFARATLSLSYMLLFAVAATAAVPTNMNVQGRLTDAAGNSAAAGLKIFTFKIFDHEAGGIEIWPAGPGEDQTLPTNNAGLWSAAIGKTIPLTSAVFADSTRWLEVTVDDGINPPETLPRIKLNTSPYSQHAADADALGGSSLNDITADFVKVTGDTIQGKLLVDSANGGGVGGVLRANNLNDGHNPTGLAGNTIAVLGDAASDGTDGKFAVIGYARGRDGTTAGVYGQGSGTGTSNIGVYGFVQNLGATENYSGFFWGGDIAVNAPATPGNSSVRLPQDAISSIEIWDEPGIAYNRLNSNVSLEKSPTSQNILSVTVTIPNDGYIAIDGMAYVRCQGDGNVFAWVQISESSNRTRETGQYTWVNGLDQGNNSISYVFQSAPVKRFYFKNAGTYTFYLQGNAYESNSAAAVVGAYRPSWLQATYYPVAYGTTSAIAESPGDFESATQVSITDEMTGTTSTAYKVDLRELELKAARTREAAQAAELELLKAQMGIANGGSPISDDQISQER